MKKLLVLLIASLLLVSCGENNTENKNDNKKVEVKVEKKYSYVTDFVKSDINDSESKELLTILEEWNEGLAEIKKMIEEATLENKDEIYTSIVEKRKIFMDTILPYVWETKVWSFKKYYENINFQIKKILEELK